MAELLSQEYEMVPVDQLVQHPENANVGAVDAIGESVESSGFYGAVIVQRSTRRILVGNHRWQVARDKGLPEVPVLWVDVDDDRARRIMVVDNRTSRLGADDPGALARLLDDMAAAPLGLDGTGYSTADLVTLLADMTVPNFAPGDPDSQPRLDVRNPTICPSCGHQFHKT